MCFLELRDCIMGRSTDHSLDLCQAWPKKGLKSQSTLFGQLHLCSRKQVKFLFTFLELLNPTYESTKHRAKKEIVPLGICHTLAGGLFNGLQPCCSPNCLQPRPRRLNRRGGSKFVHGSCGQCLDLLSKNSSLHHAKTLEALNAHWHHHWRSKCCTLLIGCQPSGFIGFADL